MIAGFMVLLAQTAVTPTVVELSADEEVALALSAAPEHLRAGAGVHRLGPVNYEQVRPSTNGFQCIVSREPNLGLGPVCYDKVGTASNLRADMMRGALRKAGKSEAEVDAEVAGAYRSGRLTAPAGPGIAYMLSPHFTQHSAKTGKRQCIFPPHIMFYAPFLKNADIGADKRHFGSIRQPWILNEGEPGAHILVVPHGSDTEACR